MSVENRKNRATAGAAITKTATADGVLQTRDKQTEPPPEKT